MARVLAPELRPGDVVVPDNLSGHKGPRVNALIEAAGAEQRFLPPHSLDLDPFENAFAKLKALLRKAAERTVEGLGSAIGRIADAFTPAECANCFSACGCDPDCWDAALAELTAIADPSPVSPSGPMRPNAVVAWVFCPA